MISIRFCIAAIFFLPLLLTTIRSTIVVVNGSEVVTTIIRPPSSNDPIVWDAQQIANRNEYQQQQYQQHYEQQYQQHYEQQYQQPQHQHRQRSLQIINPNSIERVVLMNGRTRTILDPNFQSGTNISLQQYQIGHIQDITFTAITDSSNTTLSIQFGLNLRVPTFRIENGKPYTLCGDILEGTTYLLCSNGTFVLNTKNTLTITPYTGLTLTGIAGTPRVINFTITNNTVPVPVPVPVPAPVPVPVPVPLPVPLPVPVLAPVSVPVQVPVVATPLSTPITNTAGQLSTIRMNCGSTVAHLDPITQYTWSKDRYFVNGSTYKNPNCPTISNSGGLDPLFCSERYFAATAPSLSEYSIPVLPGQYVVHLYFTESYFTNVGQRIFDTFVQYKIERYQMDLIQLVGLNQMYKVSVVTLVEKPISGTKGTLSIQFQRGIENPKINAIEILPYDGTISTNPTLAPRVAPISSPVVVTTPSVTTPIPPVPPPTTSAFPEILINCGYDVSYVDSQNRVWLPDTYYSGGLTYSKMVNISNTFDDTIYQYERSGVSFSYNIPVPSGEYEIILSFVELFYTNVGDRVFQIQLENTTILENIDIVALASGQPNRALRIDRVLLIDDGILNINFIKSPTVSSMGVPKLSGIEIRQNAPHLAHAVASGPYVGIVVNETFNRGTVTLSGSTSHTHGLGFKLNSYTWRLGNTIIGTQATMNYSFPPGLHDISLTVKDNDQNVAREETTVEIRPYGYPAIVSMSPNQGTFLGGYEVTIQGSGFTYPSTSTIVTFGQNNVTGLALTILNATTMTLIVPPSVLPLPTNVYVTTPLGVSNTFLFTYSGSVPIQFRSYLLYTYQVPTVGRFGPDQKLYVGTQTGKLLRITMNDIFTTATDVFVKEMFPTQDAIMGLGFDPLDTKAIPDVYFTASKFFHGGSQSTSGTSINGRILKASGPTFDTVVTIVSGLPISDLDHGSNALEFGDMGELFFCSGSNTNGGVPGPLSTSRLLKENFLSAGINVAYISHPDFNGNIQWSAADDGNMTAKGIEPFAMGLRNPFSVMLHSNEQMYASDNGPNVGYGKMRTGCGPNDVTDDIQAPDEFVHITKNSYHGHPNPIRASKMNDPRQCVYKGVESVGSSTYTAPLVTRASSRTGIVEFHGSHFGNQLRGNVIMVQYKKGLSRIILDASGTNVVAESVDELLLNVGLNGLDITQAPNGNLVEIRHPKDQIVVQRPIETTTKTLIVKTVFPKRGPNGGGNTLSIYGINFFVTTATPTILVGGVNCPLVSVTATRIDCNLLGGSGTVDIVVTVGSKSSTFEKGYRYISGLLPIGFTIPVYN